MIINKRIKDLKEQNYHTPPVGIRPFKNPFLLLSDVKALNLIASENKTINTNTNTNTNINDNDDSENIRYNKSDLNLVQYEDSTEEDENLARHLQGEVYKSADDRSDIKGYTLLKSLSDDHNLFYKSDTSNKILYGIRGTVTRTDWMVDLEIMAKSLAGSIGSLNTDTSDKDIVTGKTEKNVESGNLFLPHKDLDERYADANEKFDTIRRLFPKSKIIIGAHSLGNSVGLDVLYKHQNDKNIKLFGYNGYFHPIYTGENDPRYKLIRTKYDMVSFFNTKKSETEPTPNIDLAAISGAAVIAGLYGNHIRKIMNYRKTLGIIPNLSKPITPFKLDDISALPRNPSQFGKKESKAMHDFTDRWDDAIKMLDSPEKTKQLKKITTDITDQTIAGFKLNDPRLEPHADLTSSVYKGKNVDKAINSLYRKKTGILTKIQEAGDEIFQAKKAISTQIEDVAAATAESAIVASGSAKVMAAALFFAEALISHVSTNFDIKENNKRFIKK